MRFVRTAVVFSAVLAIAALGQQKDPKKDPDQIGTRDVAKGVNFYSI